LEGKLTPRAKEKEKLNLCVLHPAKVFFNKGNSQSLPAAYFIMALEPALKLN
jgi:hypothetical protein